jgi:DNA-binding winged helix-turn-helix (wHTH) protein
MAMDAELFLRDFCVTFSNVLKQQGLGSPGRVALYYEPSRMPADTKAGKPQVDPARYELKVGGQRVKLERQPMELLIFLAQRKDRLVTRDDIVERLWGKSLFVDADQSINGAVRKIRSALGDNPASPRYLETVVGKGYRLIGDVEIIQPPPAPSFPRLAETTDPTGLPEVVASTSRNRSQRALVWVALLLAVIALGSWMSWQWRERHATERGTIRSLAVLPLANLSGDTSQDYFAESMTDELITELAKIGAFRVISRTSSTRYRSTTKS